jgi:hypothetical protein
VKNLNALEKHDKSEISKENCKNKNKKLQNLRGVISFTTRHHRNMFSFASRHNLIDSNT